MSNSRDFNAINFYNTIVYGTQQEEVLLDFFQGTDPPVLFDHCLLRTQINPADDYFIQVLFNQNPMFNDVQGNDYRLSENSPAIGAGNLNISAFIPKDILGNDRTSRSDIGAIQYHPLEDEK